MGIEMIYKIMEEHPKKFLVPPILICLLVDFYFVENLFVYFLLAIPIISFTHFYLKFLKGFFKKERDGRKGNTVQRYAFPSYHTGLATILSLIQGIILPLTMPVMIFLITITAYGRIKLNKHNWKDVTAGFLFVIPLVVVYYFLIYM